MDRALQATETSWVLILCEMAVWCGILSRGGLGPALWFNRIALAAVLEIDYKVAWVETG